MVIFPWIFPSYHHILGTHFFVFSAQRRGSDQQGQRPRMGLTFRHLGGTIRIDGFLFEMDVKLTEMDIKPPFFIGGDIFHGYIC